MQGKILAYDVLTHTGVIKGEDNQSYYFTETDWDPTKTEPRENLPVQFEPKSRMARRIRAANSH